VWLTVIATIYQPIHSEQQKQQQQQKQQSQLVHIVNNSRQLADDSASD